MRFMCHSAVYVVYMVCNMVHMDCLHVGSVAVYAVYVLQ